MALRLQILLIGIFSHTVKVLHVQYLKWGSIGKGISEGGASSSTYLDLWTVDAGVRTVEEHMTFHCSSEVCQFNENVLKFEVFILSLLSKHG